MRRSLALVILSVALAATSSRPAYADGGSWNVSVGGSLVTAQLLATTGDHVNLELENKVSLEPFDMPAAGAVLDALGFGAGYSQEVSWSNNGVGPVVKCPSPMVDLFIFCHDGGSGGWAVIPDGLPTQLVLSGPAGNANLLVKPSVHSVEYDSALMAVAIALTVVSSNPKQAIVENLRLVAALATKIAPEATGYAAAASRKDYVAADFEMLSLAKRAAATIADDITQWSIGAIADLSPLALEIKLAVTIGQIDVTLVNLAARLLIGDASSVVTVLRLDNAGATPTPTPTATPTPPGWQVYDSGFYSVDYPGAPHTMTLGSSDLGGLDPTVGSPVSYYYEGPETAPTLLYFVADCELARTNGDYDLQGLVHRIIPAYDVSGVTASSADITISGWGSADVMAVSGNGIEGTFAILHNGGEQMVIGTVHQTGDTLLDSQRFFGSFQLGRW